MKAPTLLVLQTLALSLHAQSPGGLPWTHSTRSASTTTSTSSSLVQPSPSGFSSLSTGDSIAELITPEIQALASGLANDPVRMMLFVHDNIRHDAYFGAHKGAQLTLLEKSGNDFDQCALLVALLRAAGYSPKYTFCVAGMPYESGDHNDIKHWINASMPNTNGPATTNFVANFFTQRGYPTVFTYTNSPFNTNFGIYRVLVHLTLSTVDYYIDPAFKVTERSPPAPGFVLSNAMSLDTNALLSAASGTVTNSSIQGMTEQTLRDKLRDYTTNLLYSIQGSIPNGTVSDIVGGSAVTRSTSTNLGSFQFLVDPKVGLTEWDFIPTNYIARFTVGMAGTNASWFIPQLGGDRVSLTFDSVGLATLALEDTNVFQISTSGGSIPVTLTVNHPYYSWDTNSQALVLDSFADESVTSAYQRTNSSYALVYSFEASSDVVQRRLRKLDSYRSRLADSSPQVTTEGLNVLGLNWMLQSAQAQRLFAQQADLNILNRHRIGRVGQELNNGYYIDVYLWNDGSLPNTGNGAADTNGFKRASEAYSYFWSAMEHATIEQMQGTNLVASSTVKMLDVANAASTNKIYLAVPANWTSGVNVRGRLTGYSSTNFALFDTLISSNYALLLPQNGAQYLRGTNGWKGFGVAAVSQDALHVQMLISGGYNGGYSDDPFILFDPFYVADSNWQQTKTTDPSPILTPQPKANDPVSMADGSFRFEAADLTLGGAEPRGISLARSYSSARRNVNLASMAYGWTHNYNFRISSLSAPDAGLGGTTPQQMAPMLVASCAALNLYSSTPDVKNWAVTALIAKWGVDQVISNAVSIVLGQDALQFVVQPDGSFTAPAGSTFTLTKVNSTYDLHERNGRTFHFANGKLTYMVDSYSQQLNLYYDAANGGRLTNVTDWKGRSLTFKYSGTPSRLTNITDSSQRSVSYIYSTSYNTNGDLVGFIDAEQRTNTFIYDSNHQVIATVDALGQTVTTNVYDSFGRVTNQYSMGKTTEKWQLLWTGPENIQIDPAAGRKRYFFDEKLRLTGSVDALGNTNLIAYDGQDHITQTISPMNETNQFQFDNQQNLVVSIDPLGNTNSFYYDAQNQLVRTVDARGYTNSFGYNANHSLIATTNAMGDVVTNFYNSNGTLASRTDGGGTTSYGYDGYGQVSTTVYPTSPATTNTFIRNVIGDIMTNINPRGFSTVYSYNNRRQMKSSTGPTNLQTQLAYDYVGNVQTTTDPNGSVTTSYWSPVRKPTGTVFPSTIRGTPVTTNLYDSRDWLQQTVDPLGKATTQVADAAGRIVAVSDPLLRTNLFGFDADGRQVASTNAALETTGQLFSARGELLSWTDPTNKSVLRQYDNAGNQIALTNRNSKKWQFAYDAAGRLTNTTTPLGRTTGQTFNNRGLLQSVRENSGDTMTFSYDGKGRLTSAADSVGTKSYTYDANDNVLSIVENSKTNSWTYDAYDRPLSCTDSDGNTMGYRYDSNGNLTTLIYPDGRFVSYAYDSLNRLTMVTDWRFRQTTMEYDLSSRLTKITRPNGTVRQISYDDAGQTTNIVERTASGAGLAWMALKWNSAGRVDTEFIAPLPHSYTPPNRTIVVDDDNRISTVGGTSVTQDSDGNMTYGPLPSGTFGTHTYDARNRLTGAGGLTYRYDPAGNRVAITNGASVTKFIINSNAKLPQLVERLNADGSRTFYVHGAGLLYEVNETSGGAETSTRTYHYDLRGSTVALTDSLGYTTDRIEYSVYGTTTYRTGSTDTPFLYNGRYGVQTDSTGLLYMRARYYNPYICRFINADPTGFAGGLNWYAAFDGNPISLIDPFGLGTQETDTGSYWVGVGQVWQGYGQAVGDTVSGLYNVVRHPINTVEGVYNVATHPVQAYDAISQAVADTWDSGLQGQGRILGNALITAGTVGAGYAKGVQAAGAAGEGLEFSHWIPARAGGPVSIWNGNYVTVAEHALSDPYRYRFMPAAWKAENPMPSVLEQQWDRIPDVYKGIGAGAAVVGADYAGQIGASGNYNFNDKPNK